MHGRAARHLASWHQGLHLSQAGELITSTRASFTQRQQGEQDAVSAAASANIFFEERVLPMLPSFRSSGLTCSSGVRATPKVARKSSRTRKRGARASSFRRATPMSHPPPRTGACG